MPQENDVSTLLRMWTERTGKTRGAIAKSLDMSLDGYKKWLQGNLPHKRIPDAVRVLKLSEEEEALLYEAMQRMAPRKCYLPSQNRFFTGRESHIECLDQYFKEDDCVALSGLGGIGKTQLALEYAYRRFKDKTYHAAFWVNAADQTTIESGYRALAEELNLPERDEREIKRVIRAVKRWFAEHTGWLLIMDNAGDLDLARSYFPRVDGGHILVTTRSQIVGNIAKPIEIEAMSPEEGILFLLRRSYPKKNPEDAAADVREAAQQLVELLERHPLALDQAGAYIEGNPTRTFAEYIDLYHQKRRSLLNDRGRLGGDHPASVVVTFELGFQKAREIHPLADDILHFCIFLQPDAIPEELFQYDNSFNDAITFDKGVSALRDYSLIKPNTQDKTYSIHRLVQAVAIDALDERSSELQKSWKARVIRTLWAAYPRVNMQIRQFTVPQWEQWDCLLPHILVCAAWAEDELLSMGEAAHVFYEAGMYLVLRERYAMAERLANLARLIWQHSVTTDDLMTASILDLLSAIYSEDPRKVEQARLLRQQALAIRQRLLDADHPDVVMGLVKVAEDYQGQGLYAQAEEVLLRVVFGFEKRLGATHTNTALVLCQLGAVYMAQDKDTQAEEVLRRALEILESESNVGNPHRQIPLFSLIILRRRHQQYEEARVLCYRWISIEEQRLEADHPSIKKFKEMFADLF